MPKPNTLTFPLPQTAIIFLGHSNTKILHFSYHSTLTRRSQVLDASNVLFKPLLDFALGLSEVEYIQLIKLVPQKISNPFSFEFKERKLENMKMNTTMPCWISWLGTDWELVDWWYRRDGWLFHAVFMRKLFNWTKAGLGSYRKWQCLTNY